MNIAVVGGGFFGTFLADRLSKVATVTLYEQGAELMSRTAISNSCRLHEGFGAPRCATTIAQAAAGRSRFLSEFGPYLRDLEKNVYGIRKDGKTRYSVVKAALAPYPVVYREIPPPAIIRDPENYETFLQVEEKMIFLDRLRTDLVSGLKAEVILGAEVIEISSARGTVKLRDQSERKFDRIINATYTNPNLGLPLESGFHFSYELVAMVTMDSASGGSEAVAIVDGDYVSLSPNYEGRDVLLSARYSPFARPTNRMELEDVWRRRLEICKTEKVMEKIIDDAKSYLAIGTVRNARLWIAPRVTLRSNYRGGAPSEVSAHGRLISVFCGQLGSVYSVFDAVMTQLKARITAS